MKKGIVASLLLGLLASFISTSVCAATDLEIRDSITAIIKMSHPQDTAESWRSLGDRAPRIMITMYQENRPIYEKIRLVDGLAWFNDAEATIFLKREYESTQNRILKAAAAKSLAISQGMKETPFVEKALAEPDPVLRAAAAKGLSQNNDPQSKRVVDRFVAGEKNSWVKSHIKRQGDRSTQRTGLRAIKRNNYK